MLLTRNFYWTQNVFHNIVNTSLKYDSLSFTCLPILSLCNLFWFYAGFSSNCKDLIPWFWNILCILLILYAFQVSLSDTLFKVVPVLEVIHQTLNERKSQKLDSGSLPALCAELRGKLFSLAELERKLISEKQDRSSEDLCSLIQVRIDVMKRWLNVLVIGDLLYCSIRIAIQFGGLLVIDNPKSKSDFGFGLSIQFCHFNPNPKY